MLTKTDVPKAPTPIASAELRRRGVSMALNSEGKGACAAEGLDFALRKLAACVL